MENNKKNQITTFVTRYYVGKKTGKKIIEGIISNTELDFILGEKMSKDALKTMRDSLNVTLNFNFNSNYIIGKIIDLKINRKNELIMKAELFGNCNDIIWRQIVRKFKLNKDVFLGITGKVNSFKYEKDEEYDGYVTLFTDVTLLSVGLYF